MSLDKYQQAWKTESSNVHVTFDADRLSKDVDQSLRSFRSAVFWRDVREIGTALALVPIWVGIGVGMSLPWTWYLTVPAMLWVSGFMLVDRKRHSRRASDPDEPVLIGAKKSLSQVEHQIWLLRNVFWWYLLPPAIALVTFFVHVAWTTSDGLLEFVTLAGCMGLILFLVYGWTHRANQLAVREQLLPRRDALVTLIANLQNESVAVDSGETMELLSSLANTDASVGLSPSWATWSENWNRIIPSWWEVIVVLVPTLAGASLGLWFPIPGLGPVAFQSVVAAVIPFEITFFGLWYLSSRRHRGQPPTGKGVTRPGAPAIVMIVMILVISALAFAAVFAFHIGEDPAFDDVTTSDAFLQRVADSAAYPSLGVIVVRDGGVVYQGIVGWENLETREPASSATPYHVASVTKVYTATLAAILHERGVVDLDMPAVAYLPAGVRISRSPELGATITLRQLASHTSGLPRRVPGQVQSIEGRYELEPQRLYDHLANVTLVADPGTTREYSNLGFGLLGHVLECATGKPLDRLVRSMICEPLQLANTAIQNDTEISPATGYYRKTRGGAETTHSLKERLAGSGGLVASTEDLAQFLIAQMKPGVFSNEVLAQLHTETRLSDGSGSGGALGWRVRWLEGVGSILEKNGGRSNCSAWIGFSPEHQVAVAVVTNCGGPDVDPIGRKLLAQSIPASSRLPPAKDYAKASPFTEVRFEGADLVVTFDGMEYEWLSIDGVAVEDIVSWSRRRFGSKWQMRVAEDLVAVLQGMGHRPGTTVRLRLRDLGTGEDVLVEAAPMTESNRNEVYWRRTEAAGNTSAVKSTVNEDDR